MCAKKPVNFHYVWVTFGTPCILLYFTAYYNILPTDHTAHFYQEDDQPNVHLCHCNTGTGTAEFMPAVILLHLDKKVAMPEKLFFVISD